MVIFLSCIIDELHPWPSWENGCNRMQLTMKQSGNMFPEIKNQERRTKEHLEHSIMPSNELPSDVARHGRATHHRTDYATTLRFYNADETLELKIPRHKNHIQLYL